MNKVGIANVNEEITRIGGSSVKSQLNRRDAGLPVVYGRRQNSSRETDFREQTGGRGARPRGLQIRLVSGNACIIGTPTPSTTRPRASHGKVIMNRGPSRRNATVRGVEGGLPRAPLMASKTTRSHGSPRFGSGNSSARGSETESKRTWPCHDSTDSFRES